LFKRDGGEKDMATIKPEGEKVKEAIKWISSELQEDEQKPLSGLIQEAALRFNLSPKDEEFLVSFYKEK
jgi:hypothetical protein